MAKRSDEATELAVRPSAELSEDIPLDDLVGEYDEQSREQDKQEFDASILRTFKEKRTIIRVLPPPKGSNKPFRKFKRHYIRVPGLPALIFACLREINADCDACNVADKFDEKYATSGNELDEKIGYELRSKKYGICNAIDRADNPYNPFMQLMAPKIHTRFVEIFDDREAGGNYLSVTNGFDLIVDRKGTQLKGKNRTEYTVTPDRRESKKRLAETDEEIRALLLKRHDLDKFITPPPVEFVRKAMALIYAAIMEGKPVNPREGEGLPARGGRGRDDDRRGGGRRDDYDDRDRRSSRDDRDRDDRGRGDSRTIDAEDIERDRRRREDDRDPPRREPRSRGSSPREDVPPPRDEDRGGEPRRGGRRDDDSRYDREPPRRRAEQSAMEFSDRADRRGESAPDDDDAPRWMKD